MLQCEWAHFKWVAIGSCISKVMDTSTFECNVLSCGEQGGVEGDRMGRNIINYLVNEFLPRATLGGRALAVLGRTCNLWAV